ncbi:MAG: WD40/YVTN/BNR-like repeat-containing protein [Ktedonobacteraceae bacterium]
MQNARLSKFPRQLWLLFSLLLILSACAPTVGIFSSTNWQAATLQHEHIRSIAVDPNNPQNVYAGDAQDGVFVSTDGGTTWKQQQSGLQPATAIHALVFDDPGKKLYAASDAGVYISADGAKSWAKVGGLPQGSYTAIAFDLKKAQSIYVGSAQHGIFASQDSGATWSAANSGLPANLAINGLAFDSEAHQLWAATNAGIYRSPDGGASWQVLNNGLPADANIFTVLPASIDGGAQGLIFAGTDKGFYLSQDSAAHWKTSQTPLTRISIYDVLVDYHTVTTVYIATGTVGILRSLDSGENWGGFASGLPTHQPVYAMAMGATNYDQLFVASNNIYLYPGTSSIFDPTRLLPFVLVIVFFYILIRLSMRRRKSSRAVARSENTVEPEDAHEHAPSPLEETDKLPVSSEEKSDNSKQNE